jgi:hypothetical protein
MPATNRQRVGPFPWLCQQTHTLMKEHPDFEGLAMMEFVFEISWGNLH